MTALDKPVMEMPTGEPGLIYVMPPGGARFHYHEDSEKTDRAWRDDAFRGYADHMETPEFAEAAARLFDLAARRRTAVMCAEAAWSRCHRALIADYAKARGARVEHITGEGPAEEHPYTPEARLVDGRLSYERDGLLPFPE